jgi:hypothetical protein
MAMHDDFGPFAIGQQKLISDPEEISLSLRVEGNPRAHARMNKKIVAQGEAWFELVEQIQMRFRDGGQQVVARS